MTRKLFGTKSITHLIYGLIMLLPFAMVLGRVCYTVVNKNAQDSYYGETVNQKSYEYTKVNDLVINTKYYYTYNPSFTNVGWQDYFIQGYNFELLNNAFTFDTTNIYMFGYYQSNTNVYSLSFYDINYSLIYEYRYTNANQLMFSFQYNNLIKRYTFNNNEVLNFDNLYSIQYNNYSYLDNAFEYSLSQFTEDNNLGFIDFFGWFTNLFLNQTNSHNMIYLNFANWYMNYALLVSSGYLLFLALLWFINYVRRILDKSMNYDFGGF